MTSPAVEIDVDLPLIYPLQDLREARFGGVSAGCSISALSTISAWWSASWSPMPSCMGKARLGCGCKLDDGDVRGEVIDAGGGFEYKLREPELCATAGRGLLIVNQLTTRWGVHEGTTHVWFEILAGARGPDDASPHIGEEKRPLQDSL